MAGYLAYRLTASQATMTAPTDTPLLTAALGYARRGWAVVPLHTPVNGGCSCRARECTSAGKHPRTRNGLTDATTDPGQITTWWGMWPDANIGVSCGPSSLVVIDIDPRHGGDESWRDLEEKLGHNLGDTVQAITGGGGSHIVYACPRGERIANVSNSPKFVGPLGVGIDVRASGGYFVAPPSLHPSGDNYEWPAGWGPDDRPVERLPLSLFELLVSRSDRPDREREPVNVREILDGVPEGGRDWALFQMASKLRYADIPRQWAYELVESAAAACSPPFPRLQARKKVDSAYDRYAAGEGAFATPDDMRHAEGLAGRELLGAAIRDGVPETNWLLEPALVRGRIHMLYGEPESGKTVISLAWLRQVIEAEHDVLFIDEESGIVAVAGLLKAMGVDPGLVDKHVHYFPFPGIGKEDYSALLTYADELRPALCVFDSLTDMLAVAGLDENSGIEVTGWMLDVAQALARRDYAPAVILVDHVTKDTANIKYSVASRAKKAKSDVLWYVEKKDDFDQTKTAKVELSRHKNRPGVMPKHIVYMVGGQNGRLICEPFDALRHGISTWPDGSRNLLLWLVENDGMGLTSEAARAFGVTRQTIGEWAKALLSRDLVRRIGESTLSGFEVLEKGMESVRSDAPSVNPDATERQVRASDPPPLLRGDLTLSRTADGPPKLVIPEEDTAWSV